MGHRLARVIDEELLSRSMLLPKTPIEGREPGPIEITEAAVLIAVGMLRLVLLPEQRQGDALARQLLMHGRPIRDAPRRVLGRCDDRGQLSFQTGLVQVVGQRPRETHRLRPIHGLRHRAPRHPTTGGHLSVAQPAGPFESKHVFDLAHGHSFRWHRHLLHENGGDTIPKGERPCIAEGSDEDGDRPPALFRRMSATDFEATRTSGRLPGGISGRVLSEWVADLRRNQWLA